MIIQLPLFSPPLITSMAVPRHGDRERTDDFILPGHWCFHIYSYNGMLRLNEAEFSISPGTASIIPAGTRMHYRYDQPGEHVFFHFIPGVAKQMSLLPAVFHLKERYVVMDHRARRAVERAPVNASLATSTLWSLLCELADVEGQALGGTSDDLPSLVQQALVTIEKRFCEPISVRVLCAELGVSSGHLNRLFQRCLGTTAQAHIRNRRADRAEYLIRSTNLSMKLIAQSIGLRDLQSLNRLLNETKGASPRQIKLTASEGK